MTPSRHIVVSTVVAAGCGAACHSWPAAIAAFSSGVVIDADHVLDFLWNRSGRLSVRGFLDACNEYRLRKFYLLAHSLELIIPALVLIWLVDAPCWLKAGGIGLSVHMLMDLAGNGIRMRAYFLSYRLRHRFNARDFLYRLPPTGLAYWGNYSAYLAGKPKGRLASKRRA